MYIESLDIYKTPKKIHPTCDKTISTPEHDLATHDNPQKHNNLALVVAAILP
jgi:hypothetical protein